MYRIGEFLPKHKLGVLSKMNSLNPNAISKVNVHKVTKTIVTSPCIYKPVGPYSQAILADKTLYVSGLLGMDPQAQLVCGGAEAQARQALDNLKLVLEAGGASLQSVVKTTILLARMDDFQAVNQVYAECKSVQKPLIGKLWTQKDHLHICKRNITERVTYEKYECTSLKYLRVPG